MRCSVLDSSGDLKYLLFHAKLLEEGIYQTWWLKLGKQWSNDSTDSARVLMTMSQIVPAQDWEAAVMAFPGKTVNLVANDVDFQSFIFLSRVQWVQQGLLVFTAFVHQWLDECHSLPYCNRIIISTSSPDLFFSKSIFLSPTDAS